MTECCALQQRPRFQRRTNGLQLPLHCQQVIGWIVFVTATIINFLIIVPIQFYELKVASFVLYAILCLCHIISHLSALLIDPSETDLRKRALNDVPEFDRNVHAHVIENGRCHLCNIYTSNKKTKHCSVCNKCVYRFDHHCKWLNNCVGRRNYAAFLACVVTALLISAYTSCMCFADIVFLMVNPQKLSASAQSFVNCTSDVDVVSHSHGSKYDYCRNYILFLIFLIVFGVSSLAITVALMHLCCFHVYLSILGISTYDYIVQNSTSESQRTKRSNNGKCKADIRHTVFMISKHSDKKSSVDNTDENGDSTHDNSMPRVAQVGHLATHVNSQGDVANLLSILINNELDRAKKLILFKTNKIHPHVGDT